MAQPPNSTDKPHDEEKENAFNTLCGEYCMRNAEDKTRNIYRLNEFAVPNLARAPFQFLFLSRCTVGCGWRRARVMRTREPHERQRTNQAPLDAPSIASDPYTNFLFIRICLRFNQMATRAVC